MALTPMMQQYVELKEKYKDCILFYRLGDFYEMFFEDAKTCSKELELTLTGKDCGLEERAPMCGIPHHAANTYIPKLIEKGYKIAICEQIEDPKEVKGIVKRDVVKIVTPGTITELTMLDEKKNNYILAIMYGVKKSFISFCDISTGEFYISKIEDIDMDQVLINEIFRISPSEIVLFDENKIVNSFEQKIIKNFNIYISKYNNIEENKFFNKLLKENNDINYGDNCFEKEEVLVAKFLINYLEETQKTSINQINKLNKYESNKFMQLDFATRKNLEILESNREKTKKGSLLWVLDQTVTAMGGRCLRKWVESPLLNKEEIEKRQNAVEILVKDNITRNEMQEVLKTIYDIERLIAKIVGANANARELLALKNSLKKLPNLKDLINQIVIKTNNQLFNEFLEKIDLLEDIYELIEKAIDEEGKITIKDGGIIKTGYNSDVDEYRRVSLEGQNWLMELESKERDITGIKGLKIGYNRVFGYYIEITNSYKNLVPEGRYVRKQTLSGAERYISEDLKEIENKILGAKDKLVEIEYELFCQVRDHIASQVVRIQKTANIISVLDVLCSFASVAVKNNYIKPEILLDGNIEIINGRHAVVEKALKDEEFISNDTVLDNNKNRFLIITGPNMAGKSTYMRQVALSTYMAQLGSFIPAESAKISIVDRIFTRIGASDDLSMGQSTFMVEMKELSNILENATKNSLIILDEIGRGTSTYDGLAIAWATVEYIANAENIGAKTLFATHYHELTELEEKIDGVKNYSVEVKEKGDEIIFLRKIIPGGADESYGIYVAKLAGISKSVIKRAKEILKELENIDLAKKHIDSKKKKITTEEIQVDMFNYKMAEVSKILEKTDLDELTPKEALEILYRLKEKLD